MDAEGAKGRKPTNLSGKRTECGAYIGAFFSQQIFADFFLFSLQGFALPVIPSVGMWYNDFGQILNDKKGEIENAKRRKKALYQRV